MSYISIFYDRKNCQFLDEDLLERARLALLCCLGSLLVGLVVGTTDVYTVLGFPLLLSMITDIDSDNYLGLTQLNLLSRECVKHRAALCPL